MRGINNIDPELEVGKGQVANCVPPYEYPTVVDYSEYAQGGRLSSLRHAAGGVLAEEGGLRGQGWREGRQEFVGNG